MKLLIEKHELGLENDLLVDMNIIKEPTKRNKIGLNTDSKFMF